VSATALTAWRAKVALKLHTVTLQFVASVTSRPRNGSAGRRRVIEETLAELTPRHQMFEAARRSADWTVDELWVDYLALGGTLVVFDLDAYLAGLMPMPSGQQDVLACALNERLTDLSDKVRLPYLTVLPDRCEEALNVLEEGHRALSHQHEQGLVPPPAFEQPPGERTGQPPVTGHRRSNAASATREGTRP
jgi:hypothetical protein